MKKMNLRLQRETLSSAAAAVAAAAAAAASKAAKEKVRRVNRREVEQGPSRGSSDVTLSMTLATNDNDNRNSL